MRTIALILLLSAATAAQGQSTPPRGWLSVGTSYKLMDGIKLNGKLGYRSDFVQSTSYLGQLAISKKMSKRLKLKLNYRYSWKPAIGVKEKQRFNFDAAYNKKWNGVRFHYRGRYQMEFENRRNDKSGHVQTMTFRNKFIAERKLSKKYVINAGYELFSGVNDGLWDETQRIYVGSDIRLTKKHELSVTYIYQLNKQIHEASRYHILSLAYTFG